MSEPEPKSGLQICSCVLLSLGLGATSSFNAAKYGASTEMALVAFVGTSLATLGFLGLTIPLFNRLINAESDTDGARAVGIASVWGAFLVVMVFGVFRFNWGSAVSICVVVLALCATCLGATALLTRRRVWVTTPNEQQQVRLDESPMNALSERHGAVTPFEVD